MKHQLYRAGERGVKDQGWLQSNFTFSFSNYYNPVRSGFGLLRVFNDDFVQPAKGFGIHPHRNMEIISVMLSGSMNHIDSMGYKEVVHKDWVQIMSAGNGLRHEEHNVGIEEVNFLQIWIEPKVQNITPRYQRRYFPEDQRRNSLTTVVSYEEGQSHCWINQNAKVSLGAFDEDRKVNYTLRPINMGVFVFCVDGELSVGGHKLNNRDAIGIWEADEIRIECLKASKFVIIEVPVNYT
jgi:quercetin 2,3-dioxygenase